MKPYVRLLVFTPLFLSLSIKYDAYEGFELKDFEKSLVLVPAGSFMYGQSDQDVPYAHLTKSRLAEVDSFYISRYEVSNGQYLEFVNDIRKRDTSLYMQMLPDTLVWRDVNMSREPLVEYYFRHPAYSKYPVVGISYEQAVAYCNWISERYMKEEKRKFKRVEFSLPSTEEWTFAANGGLDQTTFPWEGNSMQNKKGEWMARFRAIPQHGITSETIPVQTFDGKIKNEKMLVASGWENGTESIDLAVPVNSFDPNGYGLYNMAGNVEEYVAEKGTTKGGSWSDTGYYLQNNVEEHFDSTSTVSAERGFRVVMKIKK
jgi:formylglycine-generating enzyme